MSSDDDLVTVEIESFGETQGDEAPALVESMETENEEVNAEANEATEAANNDEENKKTLKPKKVARNPQPKLNEKTVMGPRGLGALESYFERVKFKGKGYEENDLNTLMKTYEYWCHRLFPKYPFDSCIARLETLGNKRAVITHIKKIRMGILDENEDTLFNTEEEQETPTQNDGFINEVNEVNEFDQLLSSDTHTSETTLTEEDLEKIRQNKERAEKIRKEKLQKIRQMSVNLLPSGTEFHQSKDMLTQSSCSHSESLSTDLSDKALEIQNTSSNITTDIELSLRNDVELINEHDPCRLNTELETQNNLIENCDIQEISEKQQLTECDSHKKHNFGGKTQNGEHLENEIMSDDGNNEVDLDQILSIINVGNKDIYN